MAFFLPVRLTLAAWQAEPSAEAKFDELHAAMRDASAVIAQLWRQQPDDPRVSAAR